jgi:hypothetical protein
MMTSLESLRLFRKRKVFCAELLDATWRKKKKLWVDFLMLDSSNMYTADVKTDIIIWGVYMCVVICSYLFDCQYLVPFTYPSRKMWFSLNLFFPLLNVLKKDSLNKTSPFLIKSKGWQKSYKYSYKKHYMCIKELLSSHPRLVVFILRVECLEMLLIESIFWHIALFTTVMVAKWKMFFWTGKEGWFTTFSYTTFGNYN